MHKVVNPRKSVDPVKWRIRKLSFTQFNRGHQYVKVAGIEDKQDKATEEM